MKSIEWKTSKALSHKGVSCLYVGSEFYELTVDTLKLACADRQVIIFDNADLYLTQELLDYACSTADTVIVSMKSYHKLHFCDFDFYYVDYSENNLVVRKE